MTRLCDHASLDIGWGTLGSRDQYYLRDIEQILEISTDLSSREHLTHHPEAETRSGHMPNDMTDSYGGGAVELAAQKDFYEQAGYNVSDYKVGTVSLQGETSSDTTSPATSASGQIYDNTPW